MKYTLILFSLLSAPCFADQTKQLKCEELWFARNAMMDRAGYCFGSALGQAVFDNSDCTTGTPALSTMAQAMVDQIIRNETTLSCQIDTTKSYLNPYTLSHATQRRALEIQPPVPSEWAAEHNCVGYLGDPVPLQTAPDHGSDVVGTLSAGWTIDFERHVLVEDQTHQVISQLLTVDDDHILDGYAPKPGHYWQFIRIRSGHDTNEHTIGWAFLPQGQGISCESWAG